VELIGFIVCLCVCGRDAHDHIWMSVRDGQRRHSLSQSTGGEGIVRMDLHEDNVSHDPDARSHRVVAREGHLDEVLDGHLRVGRESAYWAIAQGRRDGRLACSEPEHVV
jgi:hypothetical protein